MSYYDAFRQEADGIRESRPGAYSGYSKAEYDSFLRRSCYVRMRDGVRLAVTYYLPSKGL